MTVDEAVKMERELLEAFKYEYEGLPNRVHSPTNDFEWLALMQHYGVPTRLLDWSMNPRVALYFAVKEHWDKDGALWFVSYEQLKTNANLHYQMHRDKLEYTESLDIFTLMANDERIKTQSGVFTVGRDPLQEHDNGIENLLAGGTMPSDPSFKPYTVFGKMIIPKEVKPEILQTLVQDGESGSCLFPGLDGIGRNVTDMMKLRCHFMDATTHEYSAWKMTGERGRWGRHPLR
jgi:hypothetical protein